MSVDITEFVEIDPDSVHAVYKAANGTSFLMIKQVADDDKDNDKPDPDEEPDADGKATKELLFCGDPSCEICVGRAQKGKLKMSERQKMPKSDFAIPDKAPESGSYPIHDRSHARNALSRVSQHGTPEEKARVRRAVASRYPGIGKGKKQKKQLKKARKEMPGQQAVEQSFHSMVPSTDAQMEQTRKNQRGQATNKDVRSDRPSGRPKSLEAGSIPQEGSGYGRTAPEKPSTAKDTQGAERQTEEETRHNASKTANPDTGMDHDMHEGRGDANPEDVPRVEGTANSDEASRQTEENMRRNQPSGNDGVRDQMTRQSEQAQKGFKFKVKKSGKKKNKKKAPFAMTGALKQEDAQRVVSWPHATKELENMNGAEVAEVVIAALDARDARKAERKKAKKAEKKQEAKKAAKVERKKAKKAGATTTPESEEAARIAAKSISPELLVEGVAAKVQDAFKEALKPFADRIKNLEDQPARPRPALNNLAGQKPILRDQPGNGGTAPMDHLKPLEDAFKSEADPYKKEKLGNELTKARLVIRERMAHGQLVSSADAEALATVAAR
jgi:hypothetical protein